MSLSGGIDLSKFKQSSATAEPPALKVASLVATVTEKTLPSVVAISKTVPVILEFFQGSASAALETAVRARSGQVYLGRVDSAGEPRVAAAFGLKTPQSLFALVNGQPIPVFEGLLEESQFQAVLDQLIAGAATQGVVGRLIEGDVSEAIPELPKPLQEALELVDAGEVDKAHDLLTKLKLENPKDVATSALLAQVTLMNAPWNYPTRKFWSLNQITSKKLWSWLMFWQRLEISNLPSICFCRFSFKLHRRNKNWSRHVCSSTLKSLVIPTNR